jgi:hypothetical protein
MLADWYNLAMLATESQQVVWLRMMKFGGGGANAGSEAFLMVAEKLAAAVDATGRLMMGASPNSVVIDYRRTVRANAHRLMQPKTGRI